MDEIKDRIKLIISDAHVTKTEFGKSINVSQSFVSQLCSGSSKPSDRTISDICRVYHVSELWLRTGRGEMHSSTSEDDAVTVNLMIAKLIDETCGGNKSAFARKIGIAPAYAAQLYSGIRVPSDRTISDICRICHVSELWLRTGEGEMHSSTAEDDAVSAALAAAMGHAETDQQRLLRAVARFPAEDIPAVVRFALSIIRETCPEALKDLPPDSPYAEK